MVYYSATAGGFVPAEWKDDGTYTELTWPADAVLCTPEEEATYYKKSTPDGYQLGSTSKGRPVWGDLQPPAPLTREEIEALRLRAYAEPLTGSDRYFSEAQRMQAMGEDGWEAVRGVGIDRFEEIQLLYPWP